MWYVIKDGLYLTMAWTWTGKKKDARAFQDKQAADRMVSYKRLDGAMAVRAT